MSSDAASNAESSAMAAAADQTASSWAALSSNNPYFSAGFGLMAVGASLTVARRAITVGSGLAKRRLLVSLEIPSKDKSYSWFLDWLTYHGKQSTATTLSQTKLHSHELSVETTTTPRPDGQGETKFSLIPGPGTHWFKYQNAWFQVKRERDSKLMDLTNGTPWEVVTLVTLRKDRDLFKSLLDEARELAMQYTAGKQIVYTAWGTDWRPFGVPRRKRKLDSVVLAKDIKERLVGDIQTFMQRGEWYASRGIPYRRGYLLHGPPGSGKSSFIQSLAGFLDLNICVLNLSERGLTDDKLNHLLANAPEGSVILLEDIDAAFSGREQVTSDGYKSSVTFSGLLNALDGVASADSRIIFMTTNHFESLDPALVRPGRVDMCELLDDATPEQARILFERFYDAKHGDEVEKIMRNKSNEKSKVSMAQLQGLLIRSSEGGVQDAMHALKNNL